MKFHSNFEMSIDIYCAFFLFFILGTIDNMPVLWKRLQLLNLDFKEFMSLVGYNNPTQIEC